MELQLCDINVDNDELHVFAINDAGETYAVHVVGVAYYFYADAPYHFTPAQCEGFRLHLNVLAARCGNTKRKRSYVQMNDDDEDAKPDVESAVSNVCIALLKSMWGYQPHPRPFLKITLSNPRFRYNVLEVLKQGFDVGTYAGQRLATYEASLKPAERFMLDKSLVGMGWFRVDRFTESKQRATSCKHEIVVYEKDMVAIDSIRLAPYRILSFDIECAGRKGIFPVPEYDPVIQVACHTVLRGSISKEVDSTIFVLNTCSNIIGANVRVFDAEDKLLGALNAYIHEMDPLFLTGYNIVNFDFPYLFGRAETIAKNWTNKARPCACVDFAFMGKYYAGSNKWTQMRARTTVKDNFSSSNQAGARESKTIKPLWGRLIFDMLEVIRKDYKLNSYSLNNVSQLFLKDQKEDLHHSLITPLHNGSADDRARIGKYCLKDARLPIQLLDKLMSLINAIEMARVTGVPFVYLFTRGTGIRVITKIYTYAVKAGIIIADNRSGEPFDLVGALVLHPLKGYYDVPIIVEDFASLYPSIMMAHNLCYSSAVLAKQSAQSLGLQESDIYTTIAGHRFVKREKHFGVLPQALYDLVGQRAKAKIDLKNEKDPAKRAVLDGRQLALKVVCNSVYGFTGGQQNYPMLAIAESVTKTGQEMNRLTQKLAVQRLKDTIYADTDDARAYRDKYGITGTIDDVKIVYGDTDSIMVDAGFPKTSIKDMERRTFILTEAMRVGSDIAKFVTSNFTPPIKLEFEKIYFPYLLLSKKKYAGMYWTKPLMYDHMDVKGIESQRRDWCALVKVVIEHTFNRVLLEQDVPGAITFIKNIISDLLTNRIDIALLVLSKQLSTDYVNKQPHAELAERMRKRDPGSAPNIGDRVAYVIVQAGLRDKVCDKAEDPIYVLENNLVIDAQYYLENQLSGPVRRIFASLVKNVETEILAGEHTRHVVRTTPDKSKHTITAFAVRRTTCMGCNVGIADNTIFCFKCTEKAVEIYATNIALMNNLQYQFATLWTNCQHCQGSFHQDVLCTSRDCAVYYKRVRVKKDLLAATERVQRQAEHNALKW